MNQTKKFSERMEMLIEEFQKIEKLKKKSYPRLDIPETNWDCVQEWLTKVENIIEIVFTKNSVQYERFTKILGQEITLYFRVKQIVGLLRGCLDDLKSGFLIKQEFFIANEVFDSILEEAEEFVKIKNKDVGAILLRIVLEDSIRRIAKREGIKDIKDKKTSQINDELKSCDYFSKTVWRQNQAWLDIGNHAAHGEFNEYTQEEVERFCRDLPAFIAIHFV